MAFLSARDEARLRQYEELLQREPKALVFAALAALYARKYDFPSAINVLVKGLQYYPNYFSARVLLAKCYIALDRFNEAVAELEKVLAADPYNISALGCYADELRNRGQLAAAREKYQKILEFDPDNEEYAYKLELLDALTEGGPFAAPPPPADVVETPEPKVEMAPAVTAALGPLGPDVKIELAPAVLERVLDEEQVAPEVEVFDLGGPGVQEAPRPESRAVPAEGVPPRGETEEISYGAEEAAPRADELATLTLAKIYEDQGLLLRARDTLVKVLERDPANVKAREAYEHVRALIASESSPTGATIIQLIKEVDACAGLMETDELELWEEVSSGVAEALTGYEEMTVAQAVAAAAGIRGEDFFVVAGGPAGWEFELTTAEATPGITEQDAFALAAAPHPALGAEAVEEFALGVAPSPGLFATDELELEVLKPKAVRPLAARRVNKVEETTTGPGSPDTSQASPTGGEPATTPTDDLGVKPERYRPRRPLSLEKDPFKNDEDFLGWLDSIKLQGI